MNNETNILPSICTKDFFIFTGLPFGKYSVIVASAYDEIVGTYSEPYSFQIGE